MMLDADVVAVIQSSVWRVLKQAGFKLNPVEEQTVRARRTGFESAAASALPYRRFLHQPMRYLLLALCSVLDGLSRFLVH